MEKKKSNDEKDPFDKPEDKLETAKTIKRVQALQQRELEAVNLLHF